MASTPAEEVLPYDVRSYLQVAQSLTEEEFVRRMPFPFLLFSRSSLWDPAFLREHFDKPAAPGGTQVVRYEMPREGGLSLVSCVRKRPGHEGSTAEGIVAGRATSNDIVIPVASVSSMHASFALPLPSTGGAWMVTDLESSNGTFVNDERLAAYKPTRIKSGDFMRLGGNLVTWFFDAKHLYTVLRSPADLRRYVEV